MADRVILAGSWDECSGDASYDPACDLNADGCVNVVDLLVLAENWTDALPLIGDLNHDGHVNMADRVILAGSWDECSGDASYDPACDLNADGCVNVVDLLMLADNWGR